MEPHVEHWGICPVCMRPVLDHQHRSKLADGRWVHMRPCWLKAVALERARLKYPKIALIGLDAGGGVRR